MATDYFVKIDGVPGESIDAKHAGSIEIDSFSWGESQTGSSSHGGGAGAGKVSAQDFSFTKRLDKSSPVLFINCATGAHFKTAVLTVRKAGGKQEDFFKVTMEEVLVSSYQVSGGGSDIPMESVSLNFAKLEMVYKEQKPDGTLGGEVKQKYDFSKNTKV